MSIANNNIKNLKKYRAKKGWSQERLAREAGISYNTLIKIERGGIKNPKIETIIKIAKALSVSIDDLIK
jgi:transcriptional regulator with XRE-family HTH domain